MNKALTVATALVAGLVGGLLTRYVVPPAAFAQDQAPITKEIRAQSFTLVDIFDRSIGTFTFTVHVTPFGATRPSANGTYSIAVGSAPPLTITSSTLTP